MEGKHSRKQKVSPYLVRDDEWTNDGGELENVFRTWFDELTGTLVLPVEWNNYFDEYGERQFLHRLNQWIDDDQIPFPDRGTSQERAREDILTLANLDCTSLVQDDQHWSHVVDYEFPLSTMMIRQSQAGNLFSKFHNTPLRLDTPGKEGKSAHDVWRDPAFRRRGFQMLKSQFSPILSPNAMEEEPRGGRGSKKARKIGSIELAQFMINKGCSATNFRPSTAKAIYELTGAKVVYDFSAGWGDRMTAAMCTPGVEHYIGTDPNTDLVPMYEDIQNDIVGCLGADQVPRVHLFTEPAEDFRPALEFPAAFKADVVFTSCPYFKLEMYGANSGADDQQQYQCWFRYKTAEEWLDGFLFPALDNSIEFLRPGGHLILNLADFFEHGKRVYLCDEMNSYLESCGMEFQCAIGMHLVKRYGSAKAAQKLDSSVKHGEPIWWWKKPQK